MAVQISGNDITVPRDGTFSRNVSIAGTLTYEDVTNVDSIGLVTARNGIEVGASPGVAASISVDGNMIVSGISTFGGDVQVPDKIIHSGDTDTAIRFPSADTITAETGGTERLRITSDGKYQFPGTGGGSGSRGLEIDTESIGAADEGVILNARASGTTGQIKLQTNSATAVTVEGNGGNVNVASNLKVAGVCTATSFSGSGANLTGISAGITMMDQWRITSDNNKTDGQTIDTNWERSDTFFAYIGSGMSESSGIFTFPQTGIYLLMSQHHMNTSASSAGVKIRVSSNSGSDYSTISYGTMTNTNNGYHHLSLHAIVDVTNASNFRLKLEAENSGNVQYSGDSSALRNGITFIRLGDT